MRIEVLHEETLTWDPPVRGANLLLRATPRDDAGQSVVAWRVEVEGGGGARLRRGEDVYGNLLHRVTVDGPVEAVVVRAEGIVAAEETHGVLRGPAERLPPQAFIRARPGVLVTPEVEAFAERHGGAGAVLARLHALLAALCEAVAFDAGATDDAPEAVLAAGRGTARGLAALYAALAIAADAPARFVLGWVAGEAALRPWTEAWVDGLGWVGFDPVLGLCPTPGHVRLAGFLDLPSSDLGRAVAPGGAAPARSAIVRVSAT